MPGGGGGTSAGRSAAISNDTPTPSLPGGPVRGADLEGHFVVIAESVMRPEYRDITWRVFHAKGGFGCKPYLSGTGVFGQHLRDGDECRYERFQIERFATDEEVEATRAVRGT